MKFPMTPDESDEFYQFIHMHTIGYDFPGGYKMRPLGASHSLWYVEDSIGFRLTHEGIWVGSPREEDKLVNWIADSSFEFKDAYELLLRVTGNMMPALRRPRVAQVP